MQLNELQLKFIEDKPEDAKLLAIPGSGKSTTIIEKNCYMYRNNFINKPTDILIITFSNIAASDILQKGKIKEPKLFNARNIRTFHSLAGSINKKIMDKAFSDINTAVVWAFNNVNQNDKDSLKKIDVLRNLKYVFIDEAQDMSNVQYNLILTLKEKLGLIVCLIGDPNQNIYQFQGGSDKFLLEYPGKVYNLDKNYRSNKNIIKFFSAIAPHKTPIKSSNTDNTLVKIIPFSENNRISLLIDEINNYNGNRNNIAIIAPTKKTRINFGLNEVVNILENNGIECNIYYSFDNNDLKHKEKTSIDSNPNKVNLFTIHGSKGLEFDKVILLNFHFETMNCKPTLEVYNEHCYLWYVACSRAKKEMTIFVYKESAVFPAFNDIPNETYIMNEDFVFNTEYKYRDSNINIVTSVTKILESITPEQQYELERMLIPKPKVEKIYNTTIIESPPFTPTFVGLFMENIIECYYDKEHYYKKISRRYSYCLNLSEEDKSKYDKFFDKYQINNYNIDIPCINEYKRFFTKSENLIFNVLYDHFIEINCKTFAVRFCNPDLINRIHRICENPDDNYICDVFDIVKIEYLSEHKMYYLDKEWKIDKLECYDNIINNIQNYMDKYKEHKLEFQIGNINNNINIQGQLDILNITSNEIVEIKCCKNIGLKQIYQVYLYYKLLYPTITKISIWNVLKGENHDISFEIEPTKLELLLFLHRITKLKLKNLTLFYDIKTSSSDFENCNILKLELYEYDLGHIMTINRNINEFIEFLNKIENCNLVTKDGNKFKHRVIKRILYHSSINIKYLNTEDILKIYQDKTSDIENPEIAINIVKLLGHKFL